MASTDVPTTTSAAAAAADTKVPDTADWGDLNYVKINDDLYSTCPDLSWLASVLTPTPTHRTVGAQLTEDQARRLGEHKLVNSLVCLRMADEKGFEDMGPVAASVGLAYTHSPVQVNALSHEMIERAMVAIDEAAKPVFVYCASAIRAAAIASAHHSTRRTIHVDDYQKMAHEAGLQRSTNDVMKQFFADYVAGKHAVASTLPPAIKVNDDLVISPQINRAELARLVTEYGVKSVLNLRDPVAERGSLGLGILAGEPALVAEFGLEYRNIPTVQLQDPTPEQITLIRAAFDELPKPVLMHCRTMKRSRFTATAFGFVVPEPPLEEAAVVHEA